MAVLLDSIVLILLIGQSYCVKDLPSYFPKCNRDLSRQQMEECLIKATETVRPFLQKGVPELGIPSISPLIIPQISLEQGTDTTNYQAYAKNVSLYGLDGYKFIRNDFDIENLTFHCEVKIPHLYLKGTYVINGKFLNVPIKGEGIFFSNITNSDGTLDIQSKLVTKKGEHHMEIENMETRIKVGEITDYGLDGLFNDNEVLAKATQAALKENLRLVVEEMKPAVEQLMTNLFRDVILKSINRVPFEKLYPLST